MTGPAAGAGGRQRPRPDRPGHPGGGRRRRLGRAGALRAAGPAPGGAPQPPGARGLGRPQRRPRLAAGRWVTFTDDDDELLPDMVQVSLEAAERSTLPRPVAVLSGSTWSTPRAGGRDREAVTVARQAPPYPQAPDEGFVQDANTLFAPVEVLRSIGGWDETIKGWEMDDLLIRLVQVCSHPGRPQVTYRRYRHGGPRKSGGAALAPRRRPAGAAQAPQVLPGAPPALTAGSWPSSAPATSATGAGGRPCRR